ncbi:unnamed protein product, partial [Iphiclides podalirius]
MFDFIFLTYIMIGQASCNVSSTQNTTTALNLSSQWMFDHRSIPTTSNMLNFACPCSKIYHPLCATNNKSYYNPCYMICDNGINSSITIKYLGKCLQF